MTRSAEIKVLSSLATREAYLELVPQFERASETTWAGTVDIFKRISAGESFDRIIAANSTIDDFILPGGSKPAAGSISLAPVSESPCNEGRNGRTAAQPKHSSACCLPPSRLATRPARAVYLAALFESIGIAGDIKAKSRQVSLGATVGPIIASGEVEIGFQQMSELLHIDGINVVGPLPAEIQHTTVIPCGIAAAAEEPDGARALVEFLAAPTATDAIERAGLQPA